MRAPDRVIWPADVTSHYPYPSLFDLDVAKAKVKLVVVNEGSGTVILDFESTPVSEHIGQGAAVTRAQIKDCV